MKLLLARVPNQRRGVVRVAMAIMVFLNLWVFSQPTMTLAAGTNCMTSSPASAAYTVTVCITSPADGATLTGTKTVTATVTTTGAAPGVTKLNFYLAGEHLITDYEAPFTFSLPTAKWVDGARTLEAEAIMRDSFTSQRALINLNFVNGVVQPPVNNKTFTIRTGSTPASGQPFVLAATGDGADGASDSTQVTDMIASWDPNLFLYLGDVYEDGTYTEFLNWYGSSSKFFGRFRSITNPIIGNHEYSSGGVAPGYFDYWDNVPRYYSYNTAGWHFVALDSNCGLVPVCAVGQPQYQWLQNDLAANQNTCTIAYFHHPVYNIGEEGPATKMNDLWALLAQYGVDIVLTGHEHNYQRWTPLDANGSPSATGITQFVAGGGGHGIQHFVTTDSRMVAGFDETAPNAFGALRLELNQYGAGFQYINTDNVVLDSGAITCSGAPADTKAPGIPTSFKATSTSPFQVDLSWKASTDNVGVAAYDIYRNGALLVSVSPRTSYQDTAVVRNTTYTYQIRARDAAGNASGLSTATTVTTPGLLFSDGFEGGNLSQWTSASGLNAQQQQVYAGSYAVRGTSTGIPTFAYKQLSQSQSNLYYRLWFKIINQGANSVYLQRYRTGSNGAIMGVFVSSTGKLGFRNDVTAATTTSTTTVSQGVWHQLQVHVQINGTSGQTEIWLDGVRINELSKVENLGTTSIGRVQLGENSSGRTYDIVFDRVAVGTSLIDPADPPEGTTPPPSTPTPTVTPTVPTSTPTPTNTPGSGSVGAGTYDDGHNAWTYSGMWQTFSGSGPYNNTLHQSNTAGNYAQVVFRGAQIKLTYLKAPGRGVIDVYIDGAKVTSLNADSSSIVWQVTWTSPALGSGTHTVRFQNAAGGWIDLDAIQVYSSATTPTPVGAGTYDDSDNAWTYSGTWQTFSGSGPYNNTVHQSSTAGNYAEVVFQGAQIKLTYLRAPGRGVIDVYIDGAKVTSLNADSSSIVWQATWTSPPLASGTHTVRFQNAAGGWIDLDAIQVYSSVITPGAGTYDDSDSAWTYSGIWQTFSGSGPYNNTLHQSSTAGNYAEMIFKGVQIKLTYLRAPGRGVIDVYIDGTKVTTLNAESSSIVWQATWTSPPLASGTHTVRFQNAGGGWIDLDAIQVYSSVITPGAGTYDDSDSAWTYSGTWQTFSGSGPYNNTLHQSSTAGNYAEMIFKGVQIKLTYLKAPGRGVIDVYIDGAKVTSLNADSSSIVWQVTWTSPALGSGTHTVRFQNAAGGWIDLDAVQIQ